MMALMAGMGVIGYMYLKMHPEVINMVTDMTKDAKNKMNNMLEE